MFLAVPRKAFGSAWGKGGKGGDVRGLTLVHRFSLLSLSAFLLVGSVLGWVVTSSLEANFIARSKEMTAQFVTGEFEKGFRGIDYRTPMAGPRYEEFLKRVPHLLFSPSVKRIKVWSPDKVVVWSDDKRLVGQRFPGNREFGEALSGKVSSKIAHLSKPENRFERQFTRLLELYVPIRDEPDGKVLTVFEIYQDLESLDADISRQKRNVWTAILAGFAAVYLACFGIVLRASRRISAQTREIEKSEEKYHTLVHSATDGIVGIDGEGKIILFNDAAERMFGYAAGEVMGTPLTLLMPDRYRDGHEAGLRRAFETGALSGKEKVRECEGLRKDGRIIPIELSLSLAGKPGSVMVTGILRDVTERKALQEHLANSEKQALVSLIAGTIGHEINNSVTGIQGYAELLRTQPGDPALARKCADAFGIQSQRLRLHASNLLSLNKPREPEVKPLHIVGLLDRLTEMLRMSGPLKQYLVRREYGENLPPVLGDEPLVEQVAMNLLINASHAMGDEGILTVSARCSEDRSLVEFSIGDTGHGIPEERRDQIFLPFFTTKERGKGTGLGLFITKRIVEQHGGSIASDSTVGKGTTFTVRLPAARD